MTPMRYVEVDAMWLLPAGWYPSKWVLAAALALGIGGTAAADTSFKLVTESATIKRVDGILRAYLVLEGSGLDAGIDSPAEVRDVAMGPGVLDYTPRLLDDERNKTDTIRRWLLTAVVADEASIASGMRYLSFFYGGVPYVRPYSLAEESKPKFSFHAEALTSKIGLVPGKGVPIKISATGPEPQFVHLAGEALLEQKGLAPLVNSWVLCSNEEDAPTTCTTPTVVKPDATTIVWLKPKAPSTLVGEFKGPALIVSDRKPEGELLPVTVDGTSTRRQWLGVASIFLGVGFSWIVGTLLRSLSLRNQLLIPLRRIQSRVARISSSFGTLRNEIRDTAEVFKTQLHELQTSSQDSHLEAEGAFPDWKVPLAYASPADTTVLYRERLHQFAEKTALLEMILIEGLQEISRRLHRQPSPNEVAAAGAASNTIAALADQGAVVPTTTAATISQAVTGFIDRTRRPAAFATGSAIFNAKERSVTQLEASVTTINLGIWIFVSAVTTILGATTLVFNNPAFGVGLDYWYCVLWGFGLPTAAGQMVSGSSVTSALHLSTPS